MLENKEFQETQSPADLERPQNRKVYLPKVDIYETKDAVILIADMPGVDDKSVNAVLEKNVLSLSGKAELPAFSGYTIVYGEYDGGDYHREFTISDEIDKDNIGATMKNGLFRLVLPKAQKVKAKKITVQTE
ncbi:MAG: Hsp20/alpha crystallin family protein [Syntrophobacterales bacterium]|jgi:HSP20 family molecular chaperone IbpA|nr:Hsp20/alpha crystallin family protein [Syntrophobacterales bacterium]